MAKHKDGKKHKKGSQFVIRVDKSERDAFVSLCDALDTSAAREIRRFMRDWVSTNTPKPADDREQAAELSPPSETAADQAPVDTGLVQADGPDIEAPGMITVLSSEGVAEEPKSRRKSVKKK